MDCIIERGDPFDCTENTSQEDRRVRSKYSSSKKRAAPLETVEMQENPKDPFTCFVQEILAKTVFRDSIPSQPPNKETDSPDLLRDKIMYHAAVQGSRHFKKEILDPLLQKIDSMIHDKLDIDLYYAIREQCRMTVTKIPEPVISDWSGIQGAEYTLNFGQSFSINVSVSESEFIKALHNLYHLEKYITAIIIDNVKKSEGCFENYTQAWEFLATSFYAEKPIKDWEDLTFILFVDYMLQLWMTIQFFQTL